MYKKRLLITGLSGFVGNHIKAMAECGKLEGYELMNTDKTIDLLSPDSIKDWVAEARPDAVIHLAGQTFVPESFSNPRSTYDVNFYGTFNLLQALNDVKFTGRFLYVSSGDVYGQVSINQLPVSEDQVIAPRNPYAVSKGAAELLCGQWNSCESFDLLVARPFNHIGAGQTENFVVSSMARQIARIALGKQSFELSVGDVEVTRDFLHVEDVIYAYISLLDDGNAGETYNVCSGREYVVRELIETLIDLAQVSVELVVDAKKLRKSEQRRVRGDNKKLIKCTNWLPQKTMDDTLLEIFEYWVAREK